MATSIRLIRRYVWLIETILRSGPVSMEDINRKWSENRLLNDNREQEIPERTFHRHREGAYEIFGVRIGCDRKRGNLYYIENPEALTEPGLTSSLFTRLALDNRLLDNKALEARVIDEPAPGGAEFLTTVIDALSSRQRVDIEYVSQLSGRLRSERVEPQFLKKHQRRWYMVARMESGMITILALDRLERVSLTDEGYEYDPSVNPADYFKDVVGVNIDTDYECEPIEIRVKAPQRNYLDHLPLHHSQTCIRRDDGSSDYRFILRAEYEFQHELLRMAPDVEVLKPLWLRHQLHTYATQTAALNDMS